MNERTCIVTRRPQDADALLRFVAGPQGVVVPDLKRNLPGRGCWVSANRDIVGQAAGKNLFRRALKCDVTVSPDLADEVDTLLVRSALGALGLARKAGNVVLGAAQVEASVRSGKALAVLHALEAANDGARKIAGARRAVAYLDGPDIPAFKLFSETDLSLAFGGANVIHAGVLDGNAGAAAFRRVVALDRYRSGSPEKIEPAAANAVKDTE